MTENQDAANKNEKPAEGLSSRQQYNIVSDTVTGVNVRLKDNLIQAIVIFVFVVLGGVIGALFVEERLAGALVGVLVGLVLGLFLSGIGLMIYRGVKHLRGRHD